MGETVGIEQLEARIRRLEERLDALEHPQPVLRAVEVEPDAATLDEADFDLALVGRVLIILGGAYLLRAITEAHWIPTAAGVALGLLYAVTWSLLSLRTAVSRSIATYYGVATAFTALPLIFEATRKFNVFSDWSAAAALTAVAAVMFVLVYRKRLHGIAWTFTLMSLVLAPLLMSVTKSVVPFLLYLVVLGVTTLWLGYTLEWRLLRWLVAGEVNAALLVVTVLVVTNRLPLAPAAAIAVNCIAFAAYLASFAVRTLVKRREVVGFEIAQIVGIAVVGLGGAMAIAADSGTLEITLAVSMLLLALASYGVSFAFVMTPNNFVFYSSLGLILIIAGGAFIADGSALWTALALTSAYLAVRFRKSSLALHAAVYLFSGFAGAGLISLGMRSMVWKIDGPLVITPGTILLLLACIAASTIRPIERQGSFQLWTFAKAMILAELGWSLATLFMAALVDGRMPDPAIVAVVRTAVLAALTIGTAWASRFERLSPARLLTNPLLIALGVKLLWEDFRVGRPSTLFVSLGIVGTALIVAPRLRRQSRSTIPSSLSTRTSGTAAVP